MYEITIQNQVIMTITKSVVLLHFAVKRALYYIYLFAVLQIIKSLYKGIQGEGLYCKGIGFKHRGL